MLIKQFSGLLYVLKQLTAKCSALKTMYRYVVITILFVMLQCKGAPSPLRLTIDCSSEEREFGRSSSFRRRPSDRFDTFCDLIHKAIPDAVKDGRFIVDRDDDQVGFSDTQVLKSMPPPEGFIPKLSLPRFKPRLKVPKIKVPGLRPEDEYLPPRVGRLMSFSYLRSSSEDETSAERMEVFKKGVQKMLHVVKVLGQIDQYLSERTRIVIDKLSKTFSD